MPKNRFADVRYHTLDMCLRDKHRYYTIYDLAKKCTEAIYNIDEEERKPISIRQIRNDLLHLESEAGYKADIVSKKIPGSKKHFFRYADPDFSISKRPMSDKDLDNLKSAIYVLQRFKGLHNEDWINEFSARVENLHGIHRDGDSSQAQIIQFDQDEFFKGSEWILPIYRAIEKRYTLEVHYQAFGKKEEVYQISPYLLKQFNKRWFMLCLSGKMEHMTTIPLDRILEMKEGIDPYIPYEGDHPSEFFEDIVGVINDPAQEVLSIVLEVEESLVPYLESKAIHGSQKTKKPTSDPRWYSIELKLKPNYEFYAQILSHGPRIKVVSPEVVRAKIKSLIHEMMSKY